MCPEYYILMAMMLSVQSQILLGWLTKDKHPSSTEGSKINM